MLANSAKSLAFGEQLLNLCGIVIIGVDVNDSDAFDRPELREPRRHVLLYVLAGAVVADEADRLEAAGPQAPGDPFQHLAEDRIRHADGASEPQMTFRRLVTACGTYETTGATSVRPSACAIFTAAWPAM